MDAAVCTVGEALGEMLLANGWTKQQAATKLGVSERVCEEMMNEMMPLTGKTARSVAAFLCETFHGASAQLLADYLLNGLHFWELKHSGPGHTRIAARRKGSPNDKKKP
jgi:plasmid maintenance system antidote protein VapI